MVSKRISKYLQKLFTALGVPLFAIVMALGIGCLLIFLMGLNPREAVSALQMGAFGSKEAVGETIVKMSPLILAALSFALAKRCGLLNIGAEGQVYAGGMCATIVGLCVKGLPSPLHILLCFVAGFLGGGLVGGLAGWLKVQFGSSELITTIMLNYIFTFLSNYVACVALVEPPGNFPQTAQVLPTAQLARIWPGTRVTIGIFVALFCLLFYYIFLWRTKSGYETRVVGLNPNAAHYAGINVKNKTVTIMLLSGGIAGLAGVIEILGAQIRLYQNFSPGYGFDGIAISLLGLNTPIGILLSALLFGALRAGSNMMQVLASVPSAMIYIIQALVIVFVVCSQSILDMLKKRSARLKMKGA